jgi:hypothetical protein
MDERDGDEALAGGVIRTVIAIVTLVIFLGAVGYSYGQDLTQFGLGLFNQARSVGAAPVAGSRYFNVENNSDASQAQVDGVVRTLETNYESLNVILKRSSQDKIPVLIANGSGPAVADGQTLAVNYDNGILDLDKAPLFLALLMDGEDIKMVNSSNLLPALGFAGYVTEEAGLAEPFFRQPADAWVTLLRQSKDYLPLAEAWKAKFPQDADTLDIFLRSVLESSSFMHWFADNYGMDAAHSLVQSGDIAKAGPLTLDEAETKWLAALVEKQVEPKSCQLAVPRGNFLGIICEKINESSR